MKSAQLQNILLMDMDGVLLTPGGYHQAVKDAVAQMGNLLGFSDVHLDQDDILALEAAGITNEWDTAAICLALLAGQLWTQQPETTVSADRLLAPIEPHGIAPPDFKIFFERMADPADRDVPGLPRARRLLPDCQQQFFDEAYLIEGLSQRLQQEYVLGSQAFNATYDLPAHLQVESYLLTKDRSNVSPRLRKLLLNWRAQPENQAVIFTNRPGGLNGLPEQATFSNQQTVVFTPEAELGAHCVDLDGLDIMGSGGIMWLEAERNETLSTFNKPHPIHALAALALAAGRTPQKALRQAAALALDNLTAAVWVELDQARVWVFEDSVGGLTSLKVAADLLQQIGVTLDIRLVGVAENPRKSRALVEAGGTVYAEFETALRVVIAT